MSSDEIGSLGLFTAGFTAAAGLFSVITAGAAGKSHF